ncbi:putative ABC transporter permease subunit [Paenibacillus lutrae]|uniref:Uncharacterized protein n=1 Tax=Paenibacillus lutrae TaxID=2078573 RepID=A0A7X3K0L9_9BACL|nr:hypothetical protein [Paenibacillus lutrae]MVP01298.1 hypothetical protein [Paenibacillus lutrae]
MNRTWLLTRMLLKNGGGLLMMGGAGEASARGGGAAGKKKARQTVLKVLLALVLASLIFPISAFVSSLYEGLAQTGQEGALLGLGMCVVSMAVLLFGIFYVINVFYFAQDIDQLLPLPLRPYQILSAKFIVTLLYEYVLIAIFFGPLLVVYGVKSGAGILFYVYGLAVFLALPVIPLVIASLLAMVLMRFTNVAKNKDRFRMFAGILAVGLSLGINLVFQRMTNRPGADPEQMQQILTQSNGGLLDLMTRMFPNAKFGSQALIMADSWTGLGYLGLFLGLTAVFYGVFSFVGEKLYFGGVMGASESFSRRQAVTSKQYDRAAAPSSTVRAYTLKEIRVLLRTPAYFLNTVLMSLLWPVIMAIPLASNTENLEGLGEIGSLLLDPETGGIFLAIGLGVLLFTSGANSTSATAISREGQTFFINKYMPIPFKTILLGKIIPAFLLSLITMILLLVSIAVFLKTPLLFLLMLFAAGLPLLLFMSLIGIWIDLMHPKLHWDNEQKAVKQNLNSLFPMLLGLLLGGTPIVLTFLLKISLYTVFISMLVLFILLNVALYRFLMAKGPAWLDRIEN